MCGRAQRVSHPEQLEQLHMCQHHSSHLCDHSIGDDREHFFVDRESLQNTSLLRWHKHKSLALAQVMCVALAQSSMLQSLYMV